MTDHQFRDMMTAMLDSLDVNHERTRALTLNVADALDDPNIEARELAFATDLLRQIRHSLKDLYAPTNPLQDELDAARARRQLREEHGIDLDK